MLKAALLWYGGWLKAWYFVAHLRTCSFSLVTTVVPNWECKSIISSRLIVQTLSFPDHSQRPHPYKHWYKANSLRHEGMVSDKHKHRMYKNHIDYSAFPRQTPPLECLLSSRFCFIDNHPSQFYFFLCPPSGSMCQENIEFKHWSSNVR